MTFTNLEKIYIEEFNPDEVLKLKTWGVHTDLRYVQYGFDKFYNDANFDKWYQIKTKKNKKLFAIKEGDKIRGYISLREISTFWRSAVLGVSIDPHFMSLGIGKFALQQFLTYYFTEMNMLSIKLKVASFNQRAIALYESVGFKHTKTRLESFENQMHNFELLLHHREDFRQIGQQIYTDVCSYKLSKETWDRLIL